MHPARTRVSCLIGLLVAIVVTSHAVCSAEDAAAGAEDKAVQVCSVISFVEWPDHTFAAGKSPVVIGVYGPADLAEAFKRVAAGRKVRKRPVEIRLLHAVEQPAGCHAIFISRSENDRVPKILDATAGRHILTIGETEPFVAGGGMVCLVEAGENLRFQINREVAEKEQLSISSKLLQLALPSRSETPGLLPDAAGKQDI